MVKKLSTLLILSASLSLFVLVGCDEEDMGETHSETTTETQAEATKAPPTLDEEFNLFVEHFMKIQPIEAEALKKAEGLEGKTGSEQVKIINADVYPKYEEFLTKIEEYKPVNDKIKSVHGKFKESTEVRLDAYDLIIKAVDENNEEVLKDGQKTMLKAAQLMIEANDMFNKLKASL